MEEKPEVSSNILKNAFIATRPWSFTMSLISVSVGTLLAAQEGPVSWGWFVLVCFGIVCFHATANVLNDYFDTRYKVDQPDSPTARYRPQPILSGMFTPRQLLIEAVLLAAATLAAGLILAFACSTIVLWIGLIGLLSSFFYTAGPVKFKYRAWGEVFVFFMWGPLMFEGAYAVQRQALSWKALVVSVPFGVLVSLVLLANNIRDIDYDARQGIRTIGIALGKRRSIFLYAALIIIAYMWVIGVIIGGMLSVWGLITLLSLPVAIKMLRTFIRKVPEAADAETAKFNTIFGILFIVALVIERVVSG